MDDPPPGGQPATRQPTRHPDESQDPGSRGGGAAWLRVLTFVRMTGGYSARKSAIAWPSSGFTTALICPPGVAT